MNIITLISVMLNYMISYNAIMYIRAYTCHWVTYKYTQWIKHLHIIYTYVYDDMIIST